MAIDDTIAAAIPALAADADLRREFELSTRVNIEALLALLADPSLPVDGAVPEETMQFVDLLVRRGLDPSELVEAWRLGQNEFWRWWMGRLAATVDPGDGLAQALDATSGIVFARVDYLVGALLQEWDRAQERWAGSSLARRTEVVKELLSGAPPTLDDASRALDYDLDRVLTAVVLWDPMLRTPTDRPCLEALAASLAARAGVDGALTLPVGTATLWGWIGTAEAPDVAELARGAREMARDGVRIVFGMPARRGFRRSHEEALRARRLAELGEGSEVLTYGDVEVLSLLTTDLERLLPFVRRAAGGLRAAGAGPERLRETVAVWLAEGRNARRAAERLGVHKNTVLYRLERAGSLRGRPLTEDRLALELALSALDLLGTDAFSDAPESLRANGRSHA